MFKLEAVLRHKRWREQAAELRLAQVRATVAAAAERRDELRDRFARLANEMAACARGGAAEPAGVWFSRFERADRIESALKAAEQDLVRANGELDDATRERAKIGVEVEALEALRLRQWEEHRHEAQRQEQARLDEISLRRWAPPGAS